MQRRLPCVPGSAQSRRMRSAPGPGLISAAGDGPGRYRHGHDRESGRGSFQHQVVSGQQGKVEGQRDALAVHATHVVVVALGDGFRDGAVDDGPGVGLHLAVEKQHVDLVQQLIDVLGLGDQRFDVELDLACLAAAVTFTVRMGNHVAQTHDVD